MKTIFIFLFCIMFSGNLMAEIISETTVVGIVGTDCWVYQTRFWDNMGTGTKLDDRFLGVDYIMDCGPQHLQTPVPINFLDPAFDPTSHEYISDLEILPDGRLKLPTRIETIPFSEYKDNLEKLNADLLKIPTIKVPNE